MATDTDTDSDDEFIWQNQIEGTMGYDDKMNKERQSIHHDTTTDGGFSSDDGKHDTDTSYHTFKTDTNTKSASNRQNNNNLRNRRFKMTDFNNMPSSSSSDQSNTDTDGDQQGETDQM